VAIAAHGPRTHPDLPSSPTRRSSDLGFTLLAANKVTVTGTSVAVDDGLTHNPSTVHYKFDLTDADGHTSTLTKDVIVQATPTVRSDEHTTETDSRGQHLCRLHRALKV